MSREINPKTIEKNGDIIIKMPNCSSICLKITKGVKDPAKCDDYAVIGGLQYCNDTCIE